jgi:hypothetical protein
MKAFRPIGLVQIAALRRLVAVLGWSVVAISGVNAQFLMRWITPIPFHGEGAFYQDDFYAISVSGRTATLYRLSPAGTLTPLWSYTESPLSGFRPFDFGRVAVDPVARRFLVNIILRDRHNTVRNDLWAVDWNGRFGWVYQESPPRGSRLWLTGDGQGGAIEVGRRYIGDYQYRTYIRRFDTQGTPVRDQYVDGDFVGIDPLNRLVTISTLRQNDYTVGYRYYWYDVFTGQLVQSAEWRTPAPFLYYDSSIFLFDLAGNLYHYPAFVYGYPPEYSTLLSISANGQIRWASNLLAEGRVVLNVHYAPADDSLILTEYTSNDFWFRKLSAQNGQPIGTPRRIYQASGTPGYEHYDYFAADVASDLHAFYLVVPEGHIETDCDPEWCEDYWVMDRQVILRMSLEGELRAELILPASTTEHRHVRPQIVERDLWLFWGKISSYRVLAVRADGDGNGDGCVDDHDLLGVLWAFGSNNPNWDFNRDSVVDDADLLRVLAHFGLGCSP